MLDVKEFVDKSVEDIRSKIKGKAIIACSGGVDSMVSAALTSKAVGNRLLAVYVDSGLMRKGETEEVRGMLKEMGINFKIVDGKAQFLAALKGITDPEAKRKAVGEKFIRIFEAEAKVYGAEYLVQGTIAPDWMESGSNGHGQVKAHHNVGGLPKEMGMTLVEPLWDLFKEDVRAVARYLDVKSSERQPFPGPGLSVRCLGEVTDEKLTIVREACHIVEDEIRKASAAKHMKLPWQYFAVLLPEKSTGVRDGKRVYGKTIAIRAVESKDAVTATSADIPFDILCKISKRLTDEIKEVNRVVFDVTSKPPATIEWE